MSMRMCKCLKSPLWMERGNEYLLLLCLQEQLVLVQWNCHYQNPWICPLLFSSPYPVVAQIRALAINIWDKPSMFIQPVQFPAVPKTVPWVNIATAAVFPRGKFPVGKERLRQVDLNWEGILIVPFVDLYFFWAQHLLFFLLSGSDLSLWARVKQVLFSLTVGLQSWHPTAPS